MLYEAGKSTVVQISPVYRVCALIGYMRLCPIEFQDMSCLGGITRPIDLLDMGVLFPSSI